MLASAFADRPSCAFNNASPELYCKHSAERQLIGLQVLSPIFLRRKEMEYSISRLYHKLKVSRKAHVKQIRSWNGEFFELFQVSGGLRWVDL
jgi:hypothetical protein